MDYIFTIIVPVYNEEGNLLRLEKELSHYLNVSSKKSKVLFINDGSSDKSQILIDSICNRNSDFDFIQLSKNQGLSNALKIGFNTVNTELAGYIDSDLQTTPLDFNLLLKEIGKFDMATGIRTKRKDSFTKRIVSIAANNIRRIFTNDGIIDTGCPLKVIKTSYAKSIPMFEGVHRFLPAMIQLQNGKVKQVPIQHFPRLAGKTKFNLSNRFIGPLIDCFIYLWYKRKSNKLPRHRTYEVLN